MTDKVAVVTGAGKGIGHAVARVLADEGARVVAASRHTDALEGLDGVTPVALDLAAPDAPAELIRRAFDDHGRIDVLVNNVGAVRLGLDGFLGTSDEEFALAMESVLAARRGHDRLAARRCRCASAYCGH
jgi:NAD(P)-dependent dehydrogenase (short-subunit alcohol dehydrogenase family)